MRPQQFMLLALMGMEATLIADVLLVFATGPLLQREIPLSVHSFGWIVGCYGLSAAVAELAISNFIDRFSRGRALRFFYGCFLAGVLATSLSQNITHLFIARILCGGCGGVVWALVRAAIRDTLPEERLGRGVGLVLSGYSFATIVVVPAGLFLAVQHFWKWAFLGLFAAGLLVLAAACAAGRRISPPLAESASGTIWTWNIRRELSANRTYRQTLALIMLVTFSGYSLIPLFSTFITQCEPRTEPWLPYFYLAAGFGTAVFLNVTGALVDRLGRRRIFYGTQLVASGFALLLTNACGFPLPLLCLLGPLFLITMSIRNVPATSIVISSAQEAQRAGFLSFAGAIHQAIAGLASVFGGYMAVVRGMGLKDNYWTLAVIFGLCAGAAIVLVSRMPLGPKRPKGLPIVPV